jgi:tRNA threonylcarbamoyladenosine biosynthesis protein TsaB
VLILAFDTTAPQCAVALWLDGDVLAHRREAMDQGHAEALVPMINACMEAAGQSFQKLDRIAVTVGPGSFTGVRVGLATARGLALAAAVPVIGVASTEALAAGAVSAAAGSGVLAVVDTKRGDFYAQLFEPNAQPATDVVVLAGGALGAWVGEARLFVTGIGAGAAADALGGKAAGALERMPDPAVIAALAAAREPVAGGPLPLYVNPPSVTLPGAS